MATSLIKIIAPITGLDSHTAYSTHAHARLRVDIAAKQLACPDTNQFIDAEELCQFLNQELLLFSCIIRPVFILPQSYSITPLFSCFHCIGNYIAFFAFCVHRIYSYVYIAFITKFFHCIDCPLQYEYMVFCHHCLPDSLLPL